MVVRRDHNAGEQCAPPEEAFEVDTILTGTGCAALNGADAERIVATLKDRGLIEMGRRHCYDMSMWTRMRWKPFFVERKLGTPALAL